MNGKVGKWTLGRLASMTASRVGFTPVPTTACGVGVVRVTVSLAKQSYIGGFFSSRDFADTSNRVASLDARLKFTRTGSLMFRRTHLDAADLNAGQIACRSHRHPSIGRKGECLVDRCSITGRHLRFFRDYNDSRRISALSSDSSIALTSARTCVWRVFLASPKWQDH